MAVLTPLVTFDILHKSKEFSTKQENIIDLGIIIILTPVHLFLRHIPIFYSQQNRDKLFKCELRVCVGVKLLIKTAIKYIWAATWQNQQNGCAPSEDSDQPGHPPSLISFFADRMKIAWVLSYRMSAQRRFWPDWADAQADLSLRWALSHFVGFCHVAVHFFWDSWILNFPISSIKYVWESLIPVQRHIALQCRFEVSFHLTFDHA